MRSNENPTLSEIYVIVNNFNDYMLFNLRGKTRTYHFIPTDWR